MLCLMILAFLIKRSVDEFDAELFDSRNKGWPESRSVQSQPAICAGIGSRIFRDLCSLIRFYVSG